MLRVYHVLRAEYYDWEPGNGTKYTFTRMSLPPGAMAATVLFTIVTPTIFASSYGFQSAGDIHAGYLFEKLGGPDIHRYPTDAQAIAQGFAEIMNREVFGLDTLGWTDE